jgi:hypothetical protein
MQTKQTVARVLACCKTLMHGGRHRALEEISRAAFFGASLSLYADLAREALEQHHTNCHVVHEKMRMVAISSRFFLLSLVIVIFNFFALFRFAVLPDHAG